MARKGRKPKVREVGEHEYAVNIDGVEWKFRYSPNSQRVYATGSGVYEEENQEAVKFGRELVLAHVAA